MIPYIVELKLKYLVGIIRNKPDVSLDPEASLAVHGLVAEYRYDTWVNTYKIFASNYYRKYNSFNHYPIRSGIYCIQEKTISKKS